MIAICESDKKAWSAVGRFDYVRKSSDQGNVKYRRSLYFVKNGKVGDAVTSDMIRSIRPGYGLAPKFYEEIIGRRLVKDVVANSPIQSDDIG